MMWRNAIRARIFLEIAIVIREQMEHVFTQFLWMETFPLCTFSGDIQLCDTASTAQVRIWAQNSLRDGWDTRVHTVCRDTCGPTSKRSQKVTFCSQHLKLNLLMAFDCGDVLDYHLAPGLFWRILAARAPTNELLGGGLRSPSAFLVMCGIIGFVELIGYWRYFTSHFLGNLSGYVLVVIS